MFLHIQVSASSPNFIELDHVAFERYYYLARELDIVLLRM